MKYNLAIIGGGPAGYVAAIRAGQMGLKTVLIEQAKNGRHVFALGLHSL